MIKRQQCEDVNNAIHSLAAEATPMQIAQQQVQQISSSAIPKIPTEMLVSMRRAR
jgi:hypothetical protein